VLEVPARKKEKGVPGHPAAQVILVDTPGVHKPETQLDRRMMQEVHDALESRDAVIFIVDVTHRLPKTEVPGQELKTTGRMALSAAEDDFALSLVKRLDCPVILVLNKIDAVRKTELLPLIAHWSAQHSFAEVVPISARKKEGLDLLLDKIVSVLPDGQRYFPPDQVTDQPERFLVAEIIREKILLLTGEEVPYATAVVVEKFEEPPAAPPNRTKKKLSKVAANAAPPAAPKLPLTRIAAAIFCERTGQKAILIGKGGEMLKKIGTTARKDIEGLLGTRVFLELFVKVQEDWRSSRGFVEELDWRRQLEDIASKQAADQDEDLPPLIPSH
jgi:GTP-binding protein Era